ncbi:MAG: HAD family hydrolase [Methylobacterium sp.]|jgi:HAD superfamily hydrolase (TIGR01549 family)|uniref:HAD family hydrolase n=1 Tax=unclassified Methylobacterium TaxID=2615210 RepID=UPI0006F24309|nr:MULTISPECIES: HAD family hydrolase [unclassified Methylobacterium]KQP10381.1 HAD family hydrolase [Methylobacterium sp. Leaf99]MDO9427731.1 HAD family hydrolase [Methylobacterium sp.]TXM70276.1 HAD family hydrolase [Methylobacterium sp. WL69]
MPAAVIFDVDGTLIDSVPQHAQAWQDAFRDFGHDIPFEDLRRQIGKGGDLLLPVFLSEDEMAEKGDALEKHRSNVLKERYLPTIKGLPQVRALIERLLADGKRLALASSAKADELKVYKKIADIQDLIDIETSSDDAEESKPNPDIFVAALKRLDGIEAGDAIVVGDTPYDAEAAGKAGIRTIGLLSGGWTAEELKQSGCIATYRDPADLLAHYTTSPLVGPQA